jgi:PP-loop superfamily ATP-utilizing enzyme
MKKEIKFNHNKEQIHDALGIEGSHEELSERMAALVVSFVASGGEKASMLAEKMYKELPANVILLLALQSVHESINNMEEQASTSSKTMGIISEIMEMLTGGKSKTKSFNPNNN